MLQQPPIASSVPAHVSDPFNIYAIPVRSGLLHEHSVISSCASYATKGVDYIIESSIFFMCRVYVFVLKKHGQRGKGGILPET